MKNLVFIIFIALLSGSCRNKADQADAFGNFEATEVIVSAETNGKILSFEPVEGSVIRKDEKIALIDTTLFHLQKSEIEAGMKGIGTRMVSIDAQNSILNQQIENLNVNIDRTRKMLENDAATSKQLDDLTGQVSVFEKQIAANNIQKTSVSSELSVYETRKATLNEQLARCTVRSPLEGTMIQKYSQEGEVTAAGRPLAKIADLSIMKLKVYISGAQLANVKTGQACTIRIDSGEKGYSTFPGTVSYISEKAEFTPKIIQTKEERVTLVYAVTIDVKNDGIMKSGMPGEVIF